MINSIIKNSLIISFIYTLMQKLQIAYKESMIAKCVAFLSLHLKRMCDNSAILKFIKRRDYYSKVIEHSLIFKLLDNAINFLPKLLNALYQKYDKIFSESMIVKLAINLLRRFETIIALSVVFILLVPDKKWNNGYSTIIVLVLLAMFFTKIIFHKFESFNIKAMDFALILFMICVALAAGTSYFPKDSMKYALFIFTCFLLVIIIISTLKTERSINVFIEIMLLGVTLTGLYGIYQAKILGVPVDPSYTDLVTNSNAQGRIYSTVGNPNNYAEILLMTIPFYFAVVLNSKTKLKKVIFSLLAVPPFLSLVWTGARSAWICFLGSLLIFVFFKNKKLLPLFLILGLMCVPFIPQSIYRRITSLTSSDTSAQYRVKIYQTILPMFKEYWKMGVGLGTDAFRNICQNFYQYTGKVPPHAHNTFLQIWLEMGLSGIIAFVWFIARIVKKSIINLSNKAEGNINNILIAGICSIVSVLAMGLAEYIWYYPRVMIIFWVSTSIVLSGLSIANRRREGISQKVA
ncbi:MAG: O-antigen ligase family protein [Bacillota bacterium]|nr:O-antigen ligase family protein [Bacillota bacterium]